MSRPAGGPAPVGADAATAAATLAAPNANTAAALKAAVRWIGAAIKETGSGNLAMVIIHLHQPYPPSMHGSASCQMIRQAA